MLFYELLLLSLGLSMDAFAVSVCRGLSLGRVGTRELCTTGIWFGGAQAVMPIIGYTLGVRFSGIADKWAHILSFALLAVIGLQMLVNAGKEEAPSPSGLSAAVMLPLAAATSIDALAVGVMFAFLRCGILLPAGLIGIVTFVMSAAGMKLGSLFGLRYKSGAELCGGVTLIALGVKMLLS